MTAAIVLLAYVALLSWTANAHLAGRGWLRRSPLLGILVWQSLSLSGVLALFLAGVSLVAPNLVLQLELGDLLHACRAAFGGAFPAAPRNGYAEVAGGLLMASMLCRLTWTGTRTIMSEARHRCAHLQALALVGEQGPSQGVTVVAHDVAAAYCLPGRSPRVVVTTAARDRLPPDQLDAVLAHEFAHVRERHHWILHGTKILAAAFPYLPLFRTARRELSDLVELRADDCAARRHGREALARAVLTVADGRAPQAALGAGGAQAVLRVGRLLNPAKPIGRLAASLGLAMACALPLLPVVLLVAPGMLASLTADFAHLCPLSWA